MSAKGNALVLFIAMSVISSARAHKRGESRDLEIERRYQTMLEQLTSRDVYARRHAWTRLRREWSLPIWVLSTIADPRGRPELMSDLPPEVARELRREAIEMLGEYRAAEASDFLARNVALKLPAQYGSTSSPFYDYPAAQAIVQVGERAVRALLFGGLGVHRSHEELKLIAYVISYYYAPEDEQDVGLYRLQRLLERAERERAERSERTGQPPPAPSVREKNLRALIEIYKSIQPHNFRDWPKP
jgi:hypothetical protein